MSGDPKTPFLSTRLTKDDIVRSIMLLESVRRISKVVSNNQSHPLYERRATWYTSARARKFLGPPRKALRKRSTILVHLSALLEIGIELLAACPVPVHRGDRSLWSESHHTCKCEIGTEERNTSLACDRIAKIEAVNQRPISNDETRSCDLIRVRGHESDSECKKQATTSADLGPSCRSMRRNEATPPSPCSLSHSNCMHDYLSRR